MPRPPRLLLSHSYYHVMTRGNNRHTVFHDPEDYAYYQQLLAKYKTEHPFDLYHYCLMPNHVHLLVKTKNSTDFAIFMKKLNLAYFHHYRQHYGWVGHFWQDRYKSQPVGKDNYFIQCGKYIELNPVRKDIVQNPEDYLYSSYRYYIEGVNNALLTRDIFYDELGANIQDRQAHYRNLVVSDFVAEGRGEYIWGSAHQRYREQLKLKRGLLTKNREIKKAKN